MINLTKMGSMTYLLALLMLLVCQYAFSQKADDLEYDAKQDIISRKAQALRIKGEEAVQSKKYVEAEKLFKKSIETDKSGIAYIDLSNLYRIQGKFSIAIKVFRDVLNDKEFSSNVFNDPWTRIDYALLLAQSKRWGESVNAFREASGNLHGTGEKNLPVLDIKFEDARIEYVRMQSTCNIILGLITPSYKYLTDDEKVDHFKAAVKLMPKSGIVHYYLARHYQENRKNKEAKQEYELAAKFSTADLKKAALAGVKLVEER